MENEKYWSDLKNNTTVFITSYSLQGTFKKVILFDLHNNPVRSLALVLFLREFPISQRKYY